MKKSLLGLGFGVLLMLLMLAAMVSAPAEEEVPPPPKPAPVCGLQPLRPAEANGEMPLEKRASVRSETALPQTRPAAPACPSAASPCSGRPTVAPTSALSITPMKPDKKLCPRTASNVIQVLRK